MAMEIVQTPVGPAGLVVDAAASPVGTLVLGHGAGAGVDTADLASLAAALPPRGITVVRVEQPWRLAGRKVAASPPTLDTAWRAALAAWPGRQQGWLAVGGRSAGARVACRTAPAVGADAVVALAFPLHPPGRPEKSRADELLAAGVPTLVVQGERDPFGGPDDFPAGGFALHRVPGADHSFKVAKGHDRDATLAGIAAAVGDWLLSR